MAMAHLFGNHKQSTKIDKRSAEGLVPENFRNGIPPPAHVMGAAAQSRYHKQWQSQPHCPARVPPRNFILIYLVFFECANE